MRKDIYERKDDILKWIDEYQPKSYICRELKCKPDTLDMWLLRFGIEYKGNRGLKGKKVSSDKKSAFYYIDNNIIISAYKLKNKLLEEKIKEYKCEKCNNITWNDLKIPLELHHIDHNRYNNNLNNLIILCPNCHTQEHNKINNKKEFNYKNDILDDINYTKLLYDKYNKVKKLKIKKERVNRVSKYIYCSVCSDKIIDNKTKLCKKCYPKSTRKTERPPYDELIKDIKDLGYSGTGRKYGVSDNCIRGWSKN